MAKKTVWTGAICFVVGLIIGALAMHIHMLP